MTEQLPKDGIDPKVYENVSPPTPEHNNEPVPEGAGTSASKLASLTMADFMKQEETRFTISLPEEGDVEFKLDEVRPLESQLDEAVLAQALGENFKRKENFSLLFLGPQDLDYEQGCFDVMQKETGLKANLLLVPIRGAYSKEDKDVHIYLQAIFN